MHLQIKSLNQEQCVQNQILIVYCGLCIDIKIKIFKHFTKKVKHV